MDIVENGPGTGAPKPTPVPTPGNQRPTVAFFEIPPKQLTWGEGRAFKVQYVGRDADGGISGYAWRLDGADWQESKRIDLTLTDLSSGTHTLEIVAIDAEDARSDPLRHVFTVTNHAPTITWKDAPANGATIRVPPKRTFTVTASDSDGEVVTYRFALDSPRQPKDQKDASFAIENLAEGPHTLYAWAVDDGDEVSERIERKFESRRNTAPSVSLTGPAERTPWQERQNITATFSASDSESQVVKLEYRLDGGGWQETEAGEKAFRSLSSGKHTIEIRAEDLDGFASEIASCEFRIVENTAPTVSLIGPGKTVEWTDYKSPQKFVSFRLSASDAEGDIDRMDWRTDGGAWKRVITGNSTLSFTKSDQHTVEARAFDIDGLESRISKASFVLTPKPSRFATDDKGIIFDRETKKGWYVRRGDDLTLTAAEEWISALTIGGSGWRMPTEEDLKSIFRQDDPTEPKGQGSAYPELNLSRFHKVWCVQESSLALIISIDDQWEDYFSFFFGRASCTKLEMTTVKTGRRTMRSGVQCKRTSCANVP